jgi:dephospho-CoA kinase
MLIVGLTGSIGMGKTTIANYIASRGIPVLDSDAVVHTLYAGEAAPIIEAEFPGTSIDGAVDRSRLAAALGKTDDGFARLEALVHPLVRQAQWRFIKAQHDAGSRICVLDIPLLFETGGDKLMDRTLVVSAPEHIQTERVLGRPNMTADKFAAINARQMPDIEKRTRADHVINTGLPLDETLRQVDNWLESLENHDGEKYGLWLAHYGEQLRGEAKGH